jgi:hypothetical protein
MSDRVYLAVAVVGMAVVAGTILVAPYFEMETFNRCTGSHATYFDALFGELRVLECTR